MTWSLFCYDYPLGEKFTMKFIQECDNIREDCVYKWDEFQNYEKMEKYPQPKIFDPETIVIPHMMSDFILYELPPEDTNLDIVLLMQYETNFDYGGGHCEVYLLKRNIYTMLDDEPS